MVLSMLFTDLFDAYECGEGLTADEREAVLTAAEVLACAGAEDLSYTRTETVWEWSGDEPGNLPPELS